MSDYGICEECYSDLEAVWFIDEEMDEYGHKTGRKRHAVDYLICPYCLDKYCVDDSYDSGWWR